jgi:hypothetical protein
LALLPVALIGLIAAIVGLYFTAKPRGKKYPSDQSSTGRTTTGPVQHR